MIQTPFPKNTQSALSGRTNLL